MALPELPAEIWHHICFFLVGPEGKKDLTSLRLASRFHCAVAEEWFLRCIPFWYAKDDFDQMEVIVENKRIAQSVRSLVFQADRLPLISEYRTWNLLRKRQITSEVEDELPSPSETHEMLAGAMSARGRRSLRRREKRDIWLACNKYTKPKLMAAFQHFQKLVEEQCHMMDTDRPQVTVQKLFEKCPKLDNVTLCMRNEMPRLFFSACKTLHDGMIEPFGDLISSRIGLRPLNEILLAAVAADRTLKQLDVAPISYTFFDQDEETMSKIYQAVSGLEVLSIALNNRFQTDRPAPVFDEGYTPSVEDLWPDENRYDAESRVITDLMDGRIARFVSEAPGVHDLFIDAPRTSSIVNESVRLQDIVGSMKWTHLKRLGLSDFRVAATTELSDFILSHKETLEFLGLGNVFFLRGEWKECFETFAGKLPRLKEARLTGRFMGFNISTSLLLSQHECPAESPCPACRYTADMQEYIVRGGTMPDRMHYGPAAYHRNPYYYDDYNDYSDYSDDDDL